MKDEVDPQKDTCGAMIKKQCDLLNKFLVTGMFTDELSMYWLQHLLMLF